MDFIGVVLKEMRNASLKDVHHIYPGSQSIVDDNPDYRIHWHFMGFPPGSLLRICNFLYLNMVGICAQGFFGNAWRLFFPRGCMYGGRLHLFDGLP